MPSFFDFPAAPATPDNDAGEDTGALRYDDVTQDGRIRLDAAWRPLGRLIWSRPEPSRVLGKLGEGVSTVLSRLVMECTELRVAPRAQVRTRARYRFEHTVSPGGDVNRLLFNTWTETSVVADGTSDPVLARAYGQRVFTRIGDGAQQRLVTRLEGLGGDGVPSHRGEWIPALSLLGLPAEAAPLEPSPRLDSARVVFGLSHTDGNQHVNFLVYPRFVEEAALSRFVDLGLGARFLSRRIDMRFRKPSFAGEVLRMAVQAFRVGESLGAIAALVDDDGGPRERPFSELPSPRCVARIVLRP
jgi:hypothetical protein